MFNNIASCTAKAVERPSAGIVVTVIANRRSLSKNTSENVPAKRGPKAESTETRKLHMAKLRALNGAGTRSCNMVGTSALAGNSCRVSGGLLKIEEGE